MSDDQSAIAKLADDKFNQQQLAKSIGDELATVLRKTAALDAHGERAIDQYMFGLEDSADLSDKLRKINFGYGPGVLDAIPSWEVRYDFRTDTDPKGEIQFGPALALLLINEVVFVFPARAENLPDDYKEAVFLAVRCDDVFAWGCSDFDPIAYDQVRGLFALWEKDPVNGPAIWSIIERQQMPQRPIEKRIREAGIWDLDQLTKEHNLLPNYYDGICLVQATQKYELYSSWCRSIGNEPLVMDAGWWEGWREYIKVNPDWYNEAYRTEENKRIIQWRVDNGYERTTDGDVPVEDMSEHDKRDFTNVHDHVEPPQPIVDVALARIMDKKVDPKGETVNTLDKIIDRLLKVPAYTQRLTEVVLKEARENGADSPVDYGDAEQIARAVAEAIAKGTYKLNPTAS